MRIPLGISDFRELRQGLLEQAYDVALRQRGAEPVHQLAVAWLGKEVLVASVKPPRQKAQGTPKKRGTKK